MSVRRSDLRELAPPIDGVRLLIIDDSAADREFYKRCLRQTGTSVTTAASGEEGREFLKEQSFDCVLLDYFMPRQNGIDVLNYVNSDPSKPKTPVVMMTGAGSEDVAVAAWKSGATDYLLKDKITPHGLQRAISNAVEKGRLRREVAEHAAELEIANSTLIKRNEEIKRFYLTISHELNTPLAAARECVSLVHDGVAGKLSDNQKEFLEDAVASHDQLAEHLNELIQSTQLDNQKFSIKMKTVNLERVVRRTLAANAKLARSRNVEIESLHDENTHKVMADPNRLVQVLCNLLGNAIKHSKNGDTVTLRTSQQGEKVRIEIIDHGCGIDETHHNSIFDRLFQVPNIGAENIGLGLGLSISQEIAKLHGSRIHVRSEPSQGSTFYLDLDAA